MTTKAPPAVRPFPPESYEKIAYESVRDIQTQEPNDRNRLGYHVWQWLLQRQGTLENAIKVSGTRKSISDSEALRIITENLKKHGVTI